MQLYKEADFPAYLYEAHKGKLIAYIAEGNNSSAQGELNSAIELFNQHWVQIKEESNRNTFLDSEYEIYDLASDFAYSKLDDPRQAFEYAESGRAISLFNLLQSGVKVNGDDEQHDQLGS